jgi:hypothetical protein
VGTEARERRLAGLPTANGVAAGVA